MKKQVILRLSAILIILITSAVFTNTAKAQDNDPVFTVVEDMPQFPGGQDAMMKYLQQNIIYPEPAIKANVSGKVFVEFVVDKTGKVTLPKVIRGVNKDLDAEALRVVNAMPVWKPGKQNGKLALVRYALPINFQLAAKENNNSNKN